VVPASLLDGLDADTLEAVLAHELAHLARRDGVHQWLMLLLSNLLVLNPLARPVFRRILREREEDCDARAVRLTGKPNALARALLHAALGPSPRLSRAMPALRRAWSGSETRHRVLALTGGAPPRPGVTRRRILVVAPFVLFTVVQPHVVLLVGGRLLPVF
jgi:Zn-dependent protease with chaperone function